MLRALSLVVVVFVFVFVFVFVVTVWEGVSSYAYGASKGSRYWTGDAGRVILSFVKKCLKIVIILSRVITNYITCHDKTTMIIILTNSYLRARVCSLTKGHLTWIILFPKEEAKYTTRLIKLVKRIIINLSMRAIDIPDIGYSCRIEVQIFSDILKIVRKYRQNTQDWDEEWAIESEIAKQAKITRANMQVIVYVTRLSQPLFYTFNDGSSSFAHRSTQTKTLTRFDLSSMNRII
ncbi:hypothetical protein G5I_12395 [Acromyrmex echinatior]|uniref:Uncharacterized protein n=1 Tax=Acromyrmex echinatior TaxID=103372 RepID=F4X273_ACREC|nr:hypothetical protein G5I_12395 [Acromyrmex echinatior]